MKHLNLRGACLFVCLLFSGTILAQTFISGKVVSSDKQTPLTGATITIKGTREQALTNSGGSFSINAENGATLIISFAGFDTREIKAAEIKDLITLPQVNSQLNEVVVTGYSTQNRRFVAGSIATVSGDALKDIPAAGVNQLLQGKVTGVQVSANSGVPGGGVTFRVRGNNSINASVDLLYIVDDVFISNTDPIQTSLGSQSQSNPIAALDAIGSLYFTKENYDNTGWSIIHAYGLQYAKLTAPNVEKGTIVTATHFPAGFVSGTSSIAYLLNYSDYNATKALYQLLSRNLLVKTAFKPFSINTPGGKKAYCYGSLVVPVAGQAIPADSLYRSLQQVAIATGITITPVSTGFNAEGIDLGNSNIKAFRKPEVALAFGQGINSEEAGQVWFLLNQQLGLPVVKIDLQSFQRASLKRYTTLVLPGGNYSTWDKTIVDKIKNWVADGGTLITFQTAFAWAVQQGIVNEKLGETERAPDRANLNNLTPPSATLIDANGRPVTVSQTAQLGQSGTPAIAVTEVSTARRSTVTERLDYSRQQDVEGSKRINGAIFEADIDISHPIGFGLNSRKLFINKNGPTLLLPSANKYATVAQYTKEPFINGYSSKNNIARVANSAAIIISPNGNGEVVLFADDPTYRSYWLGTNRLFLNAIFFAPLLSTGFGQ